jgi:hypothetical protein
MEVEELVTHGTRPVGHRRERTLGGGRTRGDGTASHTLEARMLSGRWAAINVKAEENFKCVRKRVRVWW